MNEHAASARGLPVPPFDPPRRLSRIFRELADKATGPVTIASMRGALGDRSFAALLVFFAAINLLPFPPGTTLVLGLPLLLVSAQMTLGYKSAWLPKFILNRSIGADRFRRAADRLIPGLERLEKLVRPRHWPFARDRADRIVGAIALILAIAVTLPVPLGNWLPAFAIAILGIAQSERDGLLLLTGIGIGLLSLGVIAIVVGGAGMLLGQLFGIHL